MDYAVVVYFDKKDDLYISQMMKNVCDSGVNTYMLDLGIRPHITLAMFKDADPQEFSVWLNAYADKMDCFDVQFSSIGAFLTNPFVIFLAPVMEQEFIIMHERFYVYVKEVASTLENYYLPGNWVPHCTLAARLSKSELRRALDVAVDDFKPFTAIVKQIGFVQCNPFKEIITYEIGKQVNV